MKHIKNAVKTFVVNFIVISTLGAISPAFLGLKATATTKAILRTASRMAAMTGLTALVGGLLSKNMGAVGDNFGSKIAGRDAQAPRQLIYGRCRVGGTVTHLETAGTDNHKLRMIIVIAGHEIESLESIQINDETITSVAGSGANSGFRVVTNSKYTNTDNENDFGSGRLMRFVFKDGSQTTADSTITSNSSLGANDKFIDCAYLFVEMVFDSEAFGGGIPPFSFIVKGKKVFDPRDSNQTFGNPATHTFSTNPALHVLDYLKDTTYGLKATESELNLTGSTGNEFLGSFRQAANTCDTLNAVTTAVNNGAVNNSTTVNLTNQTSNLRIQVGHKVTGTGISGTVKVVSKLLTGSGGSTHQIVLDTAITINNTTTLSFGESSYTSNGFSNFSADGSALLEGILSSMAGKITYVNGKFCIFAGASGTADMTITDDNLLEPIQVITKPNTGECYNTVKAIFPDANADFVATDTPVLTATNPSTSATYLSEDTPSGESQANYRKELELQLPFTETSTMAQRIARTQLLHSRQDTTISMLCNINFLQLQPFDYVKVTNERLGFTNKNFEVISMALEIVETEGVPIAATRLDLKEIDNAVWTFAQSDYISPSPDVDLSSVSSGSFSVPAPTSPAVTLDKVNTGYDLKVTWSSAVDDNVQGTEILYGTSSGTYDSSILAGKGSNKEIINNVKPDTTYFICLRHFSSNNVFSDKTSEISIATGGADTPATISDLSRVQDKPFHIGLSWTNPNASDLREIRIHRATSSFTTAQATNSNLVRTIGAAPNVVQQASFGVEDGLTAGTTYYFRVVPVSYFNKVGTASNEVNGSFAKVAGTDIRTDTKIVAGTGNNIGALDGSDSTFRIYAGHATPSSAPFRVEQSGAMTATNATVTGNITASSLNVTGAAVTGTLDASVITINGQPLDDAFGVTGTGSNRIMSIGFQAQNQLKVTDTGLQYLALSTGGSGIGFESFLANGSDFRFFSSAAGNSQKETIVNKEGSITLSNLSSAPSGSAQTNSLYLLNGALQFNGSAIGTGTGDITAVVAGTNLNGGGTTGSVTLNLDSTITGNHTFSNDLTLGGNLTLNNNSNYIATRQILARDTNGLSFKTSGGATTMFYTHAGNVTVSNDLTVSGDLTVQGTTTTLNTATLNVEDKNITLNYSTGDSSGSADGAGITIQDAVDASTDATILWNATTDKFEISHSLDFPDNAFARFGNGADLRISHNGAASLIQDVGTGDLLIRGENLKLQNASGENYLVATNNDATRLYFDNVEKLATTSTGIDVTGIITTDGLTTSADINFGDDDKAVFGAGNDLQIDHDSANTVSRIIDNSGTLNIQQSGDDGVIRFQSDDGSGGVTTYYQIQGASELNQFFKNIKLGDNLEANFGTSNDLRIYHDGNDSRIQEVGTGNLLIDGQNRVSIRRTDNGNAMGVFIAGGAVELYHNAGLRFSTLAHGNRLDSGGGNFNTTASSTVGISAQIKNSSASNNNGDYKGAIGFTTGTTNNVRSAIAAKQTHTSANRQGIAFLVHPDTTVGTLSEALVLNHDSTATFGAGVTVTGTLTATTLAGTLSTASQPNITSVGTLTSLSSGAITSTGQVKAQSLFIDSGGFSPSDVEGRHFKYYLVGQGTDQNFKKVADVTIGTGNYKALAMRVVLESQGGNFGNTVAVNKSEFVCIFYRSAASQDSVDSATISGKNPTNHNLRIVKTATGVYELQVKQTANYKDAILHIEILSTNGGSITITDGNVNGSTSGTVTIPTSSETAATITANRFDCNFFNTSNFTTETIATTGTGNITSQQFLTVSPDGSNTMSMLHSSNNFVMKRLDNDGQIQFMNNDTTTPFVFDMTTASPVFTSTGKIKSQATSGTNRGVELNNNGEIAQTSSDASFLHLQRYHNGRVSIGNDSNSFLYVKNYIDVVDNYRLNNTVIVDSSRNLTNIGTVTCGAITSSGNMLVTANSSSNHSFEVKRASDGSQALRVNATGEVVVSNNYLYATGSGVGFYVQNNARFRGNIGNDISGQPLTVADDMSVTGSFNATSAGSIPSIRGGGSYGGGIGFVDTNVSGMYTDGSGANLRLFTNQSGSDRADAKIGLSIDGSQRVGIGTASPDYALHVTGSGDTVIAATAGASSIAGLNLGNSTNKADGGIRYDNSSDALIFRASNAERMRLDSSGRLGLGTTSPSGTFHAVGTGHTFDTADGSGLVIIRSGNSAHLHLFPAFSSVPTIQGQGAGGLHLGYESSTAGIRIDTNNRVGIGTTSPSANLHVSTSSGDCTVLIEAAENASGSEPRLQLKGTNTSSNPIIQFGDSAAFAGSIEYENQDNSMRFSTNETEAMRINSSGNVGIGTTSPSSKLHVYGGTDANLHLRSDSQRSGIMIMKPATNTIMGSVLVLNDESYRLGTASNYHIRMNQDGVTTINEGGSNVGIGTTAPTHPLHILGTSNDTIDETKGNLKVQGGGGNGLIFGTIASSPYTSYIQSAYVVDTSLARYNIALNPIGGNVGIGTQNPAELLHVAGNAQVKPSTGTDAVWTRASNDSGQFHLGIDNSAGSGFTGTGYARFLYSNGAYPLAIFTNGSERMRIDSSGRVGIGTSSPSEILHVSGGGIKVDGEATIASGSGTGVFLDYASNVGRITALDQGVAWRSLRLNAADIQFYIAGGERGRFDTSGNLLVGKTSSGLNTAGVEFASSGRSRFTRDGNNVAEFNRKTSDGSIVSFNKDATAIGVIGTKSGDLIAGTGDTGIRFDDANNAIYAHNTSTNAYVDDAISLGFAGIRFKDLHLSGTINSGAITSSAVQTFTKSVYGDFSTENFYRIKFQDQGGITNDVGIGQFQSGALGFNVTQGQEFRFNEGTDGVVGVIGANGVDARQGGFRIGTTTVIDSSRNLTNIGTISSGALTVTSGDTSTFAGTDYLNINANVGGVNTNGSHGLHIGWNKSNGGREINMIFDGGTAQTDTEMIFTSTDGTNYSDIFQINGGGNVDIKNGGLRIGTTTVIDSSRNLTNIGTYSGGAITSSGQFLLNVAGAGTTVMDVQGNYSANGDVKLAQFKRSGGAVAAAIEYNDATTDMEFGTVTSHAFSLKTADTRRLTINSSGRVGIGTASPSSKLHIEDASSPVVLVRDTTNNCTLQMYAQNSNVHIGTSSNHSLFFDTNNTQRVELTTAGVLNCGNDVAAFGTLSDITLKENIQVIENPLDKVKQIRGVNFSYKKDGRKSTGLIAQELEKVLPNAIFTTHEIGDDKEIKAIRYGNVVGLLVEAIKEQQEQIEELKAKLEEVA